MLRPHNPSKAMESKAYINRGTEGHYEVLELLLVYPNHSIHTITHSLDGIVEKSQTKTIRRTAKTAALKLHENLQPIELEEGERLFMEGAFSALADAYSDRPSAMQGCISCKEVKQRRDFRESQSFRDGLIGAKTCNECLEQLPTQEQ